MTDLVHVAVNSVDKVGLIEKAKEINSFSDLFTAKTLAALLNFVGESVGGVYEKFSEARTNARMTGKLLAHYLASQNPTFSG